MQQHAYAAAQHSFFDATKYYSQCNSPRALSAVRYTAVAAMLANSEVNPIDSVEARPYLSDPLLNVLSTMMNAYMMRNMELFNSILANPDNMALIKSDPIVYEQLADITKLMRRNKIIRLVKPYTSVRFEAIAQELGISKDEVEVLCAMLIVEGKLDAKIDQIAGILHLEAKKERQEKFAAIQGWSQLINNYCKEVLQQFSAF